MNLYVNLKIVIMISMEIMITYSSIPKSTAPGNKCKTCTIVVDKFLQGLSKTSKSNFGGGNTRWEEENLGKYAFSETRLIEIVESICIGEDKECHQMVESYEDLLETWWKKYYAQRIDSDLREFLCVRRIKVCCPKGTYGPECKDCKGGRRNPCNRNGRCDGDGTKEGTGECTCEVGFKGALCHECSDAFHDLNPQEEKVKVAPLSYRPNCVPCHEACKLTCTKKGPDGCGACKDGWVMLDGVGCSDLNECEDATMCATNEFCINTEGSYKCTACNKACASCTGPSVDDCITCGVRYFLNFNNTCTACHESCAKTCLDQSPNSCDQCRKGWKVNEEGVCQDVDECGMTNVTLRCSGDEYCVNTIGSYKCSTCHPYCDSCYGAGNNKCKQCKDGYRRDEGDSCIDFNECLDSDVACPGSNKKCVNLPGSFRCDCTAGYKMQGGLCIASSKVGAGDESRSNPSYSAPTNQRKTPEEARKVKKMKANVPLYKREVPQYLARLAGFTIVCSLAKQRLFLQAAMSVSFASYLYYYASELEGTYKRA